MSLHKNIGDKAYNVETGDGMDDIAYTPEESEAKTDEEKSDAQLVAEGKMKVMGDEDEVFVDPNSNYTTGDDDEQEETGEEEEPEDLDAKAEEKKEKKEVKKKKTGVDPEVEKLAKRFSQKRINKISREKFELRDENEKLRKQLKELEGKSRETEILKKKVEHAATKPKMEDFDDEAGFYEALGRWATKDEIYAHEASQPVGEVEPSIEEKEQQTFENIRNKILTDGEDKYEDFAEIALSDSIAITREMVLAAGDSDNAADIFYYLGQNPEESHRIAQLRGNQIAREMGKIESQFMEEVYEHKPNQDNEFVEKSKKKSKQNKPASPPPPVKPLSGGGKQSVDLDSASIADYFTARGYDRTGMKKRSNQ